MKEHLKSIGLWGILSLGIYSPIAMSEEGSVALNSLIEQSETPEQRLRNTILIGDWFIEQNDNYTAREYYDRAINEYTGVRTHKEYLALLLKVANLEKDKLAARAILAEAKALVETDPKNELMYADILEALVWTYDAQKKDIQVVTSLLESAIAIRKKYPYTPDYSATLRVLGWTYETRGLLSQAEYYYNYALNSDLKYLGFSDIRTILAMENFALFYMDFNELDKAKRILDQKYAQHLATEPIDYYNLARTESMLGWVLVQTDRASEAESVYLSALKNVNRSLTKSPEQLHYFSLSALFDLIYFYVAQNNFEKALEYYEQAQTVVAQTDGLSLKEYVGALGQSGMEELASSYAWAIYAQYNSIQRLHEYMNNRNAK
ncbi:tetratricopeptide repeat protein [Wohlfahrtiimonas larvae]|uniref:Tetratricopeptide repeat protein n=1 Tax=Wohlfahrtiimonas larvae TaxID=1157986 RepID=A0ABP9MT86_9GAMM|nr:tetratricopeptide repeat protein [Wohlfahrtiimonas larvae]